MKSIAIIGSGISGMGAAFLLHRQYAVTLYEKAAEVGGHTRTRHVDYGGTRLAVDTGFIVFNYRNYPHLSRMFRYLDVPVQKSTMSFGVTTKDNALEWSAENPNALFGQRRNLLNPTFYRFLLDVVRFNRRAVKTVSRKPEMTMGELLAELKLGNWFAEYYLLPMGGAIWSCPLDAILQFPAKTFVDFFEAHGLLTVTRQPQWYTVTGGSQEYVKRLIAPFRARIRTSCPTVSVTRTGGKVRVSDGRGETLEYDHVVFASHADETLSVLTDATAEERKTLSPFRYQKNTAVLHKDTSLMPQNRNCWASWIYHAPENTKNAPLSVTYWMNHLQSIDGRYPLFVTLNPLKNIAPEHVFDTHVFEHPIYSMEAVAAQKALPSLQGRQNTWFCGAYHSSGFHEDGLKSAVDVASRLGVEVPWH